MCRVGDGRLQRERERWRCDSARWRDDAGCPAGRRHERRAGARRRSVTATSAVYPLTQLTSLHSIAEEASDTLTERAEDRAARLVEATAVLRSLGPDLRARLSRLDHFGDEFVARFGRASVQLGRATDLAAKAAAIRSLADAGQLATATNVDVSVPDTAIVTTSSARRS